MKLIALGLASAVALAACVPANGSWRTHNNYHHWTQEDNDWRDGRHDDNNDGGGWRDNHGHDRGYDSWFDANDCQYTWPRNDHDRCDYR